jgi:hypothetical protein
MNRFLATTIVAAMLVGKAVAAAEPASREPYGIDLEGFPYPHPVQLLSLVNDGEQLRMAYMDIAPVQPNGRSVMLLHGRNFPSSYWAAGHKHVGKRGLPRGGGGSDRIR